MKDISALFLVTKLLSKDRGIFTHGRRVARIARGIAEIMGYCHDGLEQIQLAAAVHDIGKVRLPQEILEKRGKLDPDELLLVRKHPEIGYRLLNEMLFDSLVADVSLQHHERMDGSGYPLGLREKDINPVSRIVAVADVVDTMVSPQVYRAALSLEQAFDELKKSSGLLYDPHVVAVSLKLAEEGGLDACWS